MFNNFVSPSTVALAQSVEGVLMMIAGGKLPPGNPMPVNNPAANILANLLDLPAPSGESVHFAGNR